MRLRGYARVGVVMLAACSMDLSELQREGEERAPATDPDRERDSEAGRDAGGGAGGGAQAGSVAEAGTGAGAGGAGGAPMTLPAAGAGATRRTCGVTGLPCCTPRNTCDLGACLRGKCTAYGGFYAETSGCTQNPCRSRNAYTAGCGCPAGFDDTLLWQSVEACDFEEATTEVHSCTAARTPETIFGGAWIEGPDADCTLGCRTANPVTGQCGCPEGTEAAALAVDLPSPNCPNSELTLQLCIQAGGKLTNFGGGYALSQSAALGCSAPNPLTGSCSCPEGATAPQSLHVGSSRVFVCNL